MMTKRPWLGLVLLLLGCGAQDPTAAGGATAGPPSFTIIEAGEGAENAEPLWPLHGGTSVDRVRILGERKVDGRDVVVVVQDGNPNALSWATPAYYTETDDGVLWHGRLKDGFWSRPLLVVPAKVRVGMEWTTDPGERGPSGKGRPLRCAVTTMNVDSSTSLLQVPRVWTIHCRDGYVGDWTGSFVEGVGLAPIKHLDVRSGPAYPAPPEFPRSELEPLNDGKPIVEKFFAHRAGSLVVPDDGPGRRRVVLSGEAAIFLVQGVENPDGSGFGVNSWVPTRSTACFMLDGTSLVESDLVVEADCPDPLGAAIGGDGGLRAIPVGNYCLPNGDRCSDFDFFAIRGDADGAEVLVTTDGLYSARYYDGADEHPWYRIGEARRHGLKLGSLGLVDGYGYWLLFGERGAPGESLVIPDELGRHLYAGGWDGKWRDPHPALATAALAASVSQSGRDVLDVTPSGDISRIAVDDGQLTLATLARAVPPPGHALVGAVDLGDELVVFTQGDYLGWTTQVTPAPVGSDDPPLIDPAVEPVLGNVYAWRVEPASAPAEPAPPPPERQPVYIQAEDRDLRVVAPVGWAEPAEPPVLGDTPAALAIPATRHSALLVRDQAGPSPLMPNGWQWQHPYLFEGTLPSVGQTRVAVAAPSADVTWPTLGLAAGEVAPLRGGGFVNGTQPLHLWSSGGVLENPADGAEGGMALPDASGNGLWMRNPETVDCTSPCVEWTLWGRERQVYRFEDEPAASPSRAGGGTSGVVGGGVLTPHYLVRPDGSRVDFTPPEAPLGAVFTVWGATADDTVCGDFVENIVTPQGTSATEPSLLCIDADGDFQRLGQPLGAGHASADGVFYAVDAVSGGFLRFDPATFTVEVLDETSVTGIPAAAGQVGSFVHDAQGELYAPLSISPPPTAQSLPSVLHFTRDGVERLDLPTVPDMMVPGRQLLVDERVFVFYGAGGLSSGVYRVPRP